jgi:hypothetical protein
MLSKKMMTMMTRWLLFDAKRLENQKQNLLGWILVIQFNIKKELQTQEREKGEDIPEDIKEKIGNKEDTLMANWEPVSKHFDVMH